MNPCDALLDHLTEAFDEDLPRELAAHLAECPACQEGLERRRGLAEMSAIAREAHAPGELVARLKAMPRLAPACEQAQDLLHAALDGELDERSRGALLDHLHGCATCQATWEAFATLHEIGAQTRPNAHLRAALALPPQHRIALRRRPLIDLRLATAAAYLLAAITIMLAGNPATLARASNATVERAGVYARAAMENRVAAYSRKVRETIAVGEHWVRRHASEAWLAARRTVGGERRENRRAQGNVVGDGNGGTS